MENVEVRIKVFQELLASVGEIPFTIFDRGFEILESNYKYIDIYPLFFQITRKEEAEHVLPKNAAQILSAPAIFTNELGMSWLSDVEIRGEEVYRIYTIGPVFLEDYSLRCIEEKVSREKLSLSLKHHFMAILKELPVISLNRFFEYGIMLHCAVTGEKISQHDFLFPDLKTAATEEEWRMKERHGAFLAEEQILRLVEEGNLDYDKEMKKYLSFGNQGVIADKDYLRQAKNTVIVFCTLCAGAAVRGKVAAETAYLLREQYIHMTETAENLAKVNEVSQMMMEDFVKRVHCVKTCSGISPQIKKSCDYICLHLDEKPDIHLLASRLGYSDYYFSNKFKKEAGLSVRDFAMKQKIERAKLLLRDSCMDIESVSNSLGFSSQSYFGEIFRKEVGVSPGEFRSGSEN